MRRQAWIESRFFETWSTRIISVLVPIWLFGAHLAQGADTQGLAETYSLGLLVSAAILIIAGGFRQIPVGMLLIAVVFLVWLWSGAFGHWATSRREVQVLAAAGAITGSGYLIGRRLKSSRLAWNALNWSLLVFSIVAIFAQVANESDLMTNQISTGGRLSATFGSANTAATLFGIACLLALARILLSLSDRKLRRLNRRDKIYFFAQHESANFTLLILAAYCLILTMSRAGIFLSFACLIALAAFEMSRLPRSGRFSFVKRKWFRILFGLSALLVLGLAITGAINPYQSEQLLHNSYSRIVMFETYLAIWLEQPLFGHGLGSFNSLNDSHTTLETAQYLAKTGAAHNVVLQWLVQQGIIGLAMMSIVIGAVLYPIVKCLRQSSSLPRHFLHMAIAVTVLVFAHGMVDYALEIPSVMWTFAYILGLAAGFAASTIASRPASDE